MKIKPFVRQGNYTIFDNALLDHIMPVLSANGWQLLCMLIRKTKGYQKDEDYVSYSQIRTGTGIKSNHTIKRTIDELLEMQLIESAPGTGRTSNLYRLNMEYEIDIPSSAKNAQQSAPRSGAKNAQLEASGAKNAQHSGAKNAQQTPVVVQKMHTQYKDNLKQNIKTTSSGGSGAEKLPPRGNVFSAYEQNIGMLTSHITELITVAVNDFGETVVVDAIKTAAENNVHKWAYVDGILKRWRVNGRQKQKPKPKRGEQVVVNFEDPFGGITQETMTL